MTLRRYFGLCLTGAIATLSLVAALNGLVDPFRVFPKVHLAAFNHQRDSVFSRVGRAELARRGDWDMIILGTSRPKIGMPVGHPAFATNHVCNLSVDAGRMSEAQAIFEYARKYNSLRRVLLCLDLALLREAVGGPNVEDFAESRFNPDLSLFQYHCETLIGANATDTSVKFLRRQLQNDLPPAAQRDGFHVRAIEKGARQRAVFERTLRSLAYTYSQLRESAAQMSALREMIRTCRAAGIELTLAVNPVHALDLELMRVAGKWNELEEWKRHVVKMIDEENPGGVTLWDFCGYSGPTTERVPPAGDSVTRMTFYFEHSHYSPAMGALMLDRMYCGAPGDFGRKITIQNIEDHLDRVRQDREVYAVANAADVAWAREVGKRALAARKQVADVSE